MYRPTFASKMRTLGRPFETVNSEQLVKRFYNFVSPLERAWPDAADLAHTIGERVEFFVEQMNPVHHSLERSWWLDGALISQDQVLILNTRALVEGRHTIALEVRDPTPAVRSDPADALVERRQWTLTLTAALDGAARREQADTTSTIAGGPKARE